MNKTNKVRIFFLTTAISICISYFLGYELINDWKSQKQQQQQQNELLVAEPIAETESSGAVENTEVEILKMNIPYQYVIVEEEGYLTVYMQDLSTIYMYTDIRMQDLSQELQDEIRIGKPFASIEELYDFLENYSS